MKNIFYLTLFQYVVNLVKDESNNCGNGTHIRCCYGFIWNSSICEECPAGTFGINCTSHCPDGFYGRRCLSKCRCGITERCDRKRGCMKLLLNCITSDCEDECPDGVFGENCTRGCKDGYYGRLCMLICNCKSTETCTVKNGCVEIANQSIVSHVTTSLSHIGSDESTKSYSYGTTSHIPLEQTDNLLMLLVCTIAVFVIIIVAWI